MGYFEKEQISLLITFNMFTQAHAKNGIADHHSTLGKQGFVNPAAAQAPRTIMPWLHLLMVISAPGATRVNPLKEDTSWIGRSRGEEEYWIGGWGEE